MKNFACGIIPRYHDQSLTVYEMNEELSERITGKSI